MKKRKVVGGILDVEDLVAGNFVFRKGHKYIVNGIKYTCIGDVSDMSDEELKNIPLNSIYKKDGVLQIRHATDKQIIDAANAMMLSGIEANADAEVERVKEKTTCWETHFSKADNALKRGLKTLINHMGIDLKDYSHKFGLDNANRMNNMRRLLTSDVNLTFDKFEEWLSILDATYSLTIRSKDGKEITIF